MSQLKDNLIQILEEKATKIIPKNIKKGVTILGIEGTLETGSGEVKLFETEEAMQADADSKEGDLAVVYSERIQGISQDTVFQVCEFPATVVLDAAFTDSAYGRFRATDSSIWMEVSCDISQTSFRCSWYGDNTRGEVTYTSTDGVTYTRTDTLGNPIDLGIPVKNEYEWNDVFSKFILSASYYFGGLFQYVTDKYYIVESQLNLSNSNELLPGKVAYGKDGIVVGDDTIYNNLDDADLLRVQYGFENLDDIPKFAIDYDSPNKIMKLAPTDLITGKTFMMSNNKTLESIPAIAKRVITKPGYKMETYGSFDSLFMINENEALVANQWMNNSNLDDCVCEIYRLNITTETYTTVYSKNYPKNVAQYFEKAIFGKDFYTFLTIPNTDEYAVEFIILHYNVETDEVNVTTYVYSGLPHKYNEHTTYLYCMSELDDGILLSGNNSTYDPVILFRYNKNTNTVTPINNVDNLHIYTVGQSIKYNDKHYFAGNVYIDNNEPEALYLLELNNNDLSGKHIHAIDTNNQPHSSLTQFDIYNIGSTFYLFGALASMSFVGKTSLDGSVATEYVSALKHYGDGDVVPFRKLIRNDDNYIYIHSYKNFKIDINTLELSGETATQMQVTTLFADMGTISEQTEPFIIQPPRKEFSWLNGYDFVSLVTAQSEKDFGITFRFAPTTSYSSRTEYMFLYRLIN